MAAGYSDQLSSYKSVFTQFDIGGIIIMNETSASSLGTFRQGFQVAPTIAVDQEGGTVQRYKSQGILPGATEMASYYTPAQAYQKYYSDAQFLKSIGITVNFAPVLDVMRSQPSPLPGRMYSSDPSTVSQYASQFIEASQKAGIVPVVKHFPGLGSTTTNTDDGSATTDPLAVLMDKDIIPYQQLAHYDTDAMVSNAIVPGLTDGQPAIWSSAAVTLLRNQGYKDAVIYTDSLTAKAVSGALEDAAIKAWQAGNDIALIVQKHEDTYTLSTIFASIKARAITALQSSALNKQKFAESVLRILQRKGVDPCALTNDQ
jgi:beta-N-acetylhexosaminidase